ncbi:MAG: D-alanine--poly(phosphoribitol) ligase subunit DltC [Coriobacteriaceae bacterium]|jgi:D-alanine--poly(phosphoribitol) ligase subunit 2|nr:D-alanine--poly(phosphoribitol) ligase subunit DltC [Coriobacteriaceae bacterium]
MEERLLALIAEVCDSDDIYERRDIDLFEAGLLDSMAAIDLLVSIEDEFGVVIAPTELAREEMNSVNKVLARVQERL